MRNPSFLPANFETLGATIRRRRELVGRLSRSALPDANRLGAVIATCRAGRRCNSGACPACQRRWRIAILREADRVLPRTGLLRISLVPAGGIVPLGQLPDFDLRRFIASRRRALERALPGVVVFGGIDVSHNTTENDAGVWQVHIYLVALVADTPEMRRTFRKRCPGEPSAPRPFMFKAISDQDRAKVFSYGPKATMYRRSRYIDKLGRWNTASQSLSAARSVEAALFQHRWPPEQRLVLCGMRLFRGADGVRLHRLRGEPVVERRHRETAASREPVRRDVGGLVQGRRRRRKRRGAR